MARPRPCGPPTTTPRAARREADAETSESSGRPAPYRGTWRTVALAVGMALFASGCEGRDSEGRTALPVEPRPEPAAVASPAAPPATAAAAQAADPDDWCGGHGLPESMCTKCNPELVEEFQAAGDWCAGHGFPESACPQCNPMEPPAGGGSGCGGGTQAGDVDARAADPADWCVGHGLPESMCTKCNPALVETFQAAGDWCAGHGFPESVCPICNPQAPPEGAEEAAIEARVVRFGPPDLEDAAGIRTAPALRTATPTSVACTARLAFDADRTADVRAIVPGIVREVHVELGASVEAGAPLFELESAHVGELQAGLRVARQHVRTARANLARKRELRETRIASAREVELAEQEYAVARAEVEAAEASLELAGADPKESAGRYTLTAPLAGTIVRRPAVMGVLATADTSLATIADTSSMWVLCDVPEAEASRVALGQRLRVSVDGDGDEGAPREGALTWIAPEVDPRTRTVTVRAELPNPDGRLRANQFARGRLETSAPRATVSVPRAAVQRVGDREVVFVRADRGVYEPRIVQRRGDGDIVPVEGDVRAGDAVVTVGAVLLRTEIMPGSIGAGCCEVEAAGGD